MVSASPSSRSRQVDASHKNHYSLLRDTGPMPEMPPALFASPFPRLDLTPDERKQLHATATTIVLEAQTHYERFLREDRSTIDNRKWELVRSREDVHVYHARQPGAAMGNQQMHLLLTVGTVVGTLHDAMYGELNHTTNAMRIKTEYVEDTLLDSAVLDTILSPSMDDPFQSLTVRWFVKNVPLLVRVVSKHRDNVYLEATGMKQLANGESIGFRLMHSIAFPRAPPLPMYGRTNMSVCSIWRQQTPQLVEVYRTAYFEIQESFMLPMILKSTSDALVSVWKIIDCAQRKKLAHLVDRKATQQDMDGHRRASLVPGCGVCGSDSQSARRGAKSACAICAKVICKTCRVKRELAFFSPNSSLLKAAMRFCLPCLTRAHHMDAAAIAAADVLAVRARSAHAHNNNDAVGSSTHTASCLGSSVGSDERFAV